MSSKLVISFVHVWNDIIAHSLRHTDIIPPSLSSYVIMTSSLSPNPFTHGTGSTTDPSEDVESLDLLINLGCFDSIPGPELWSDSGELELILCCCCSASSKFLVRASISAVVSAWVSTAGGRGKRGRREERGKEERREQKELRAKKVIVYSNLLKIHPWVIK